jgi:hypothetical protein
MTMKLHIRRAKPEEVVVSVPPSFSGRLLCTHIYVLNHYKSKQITYHTKCFYIHLI